MESCQEQPMERTDAMKAMSKKLEIEHSGRWLEVSNWIFRSWTGNRRKNGKEYKGPVYILGTNKKYQAGSAVLVATIYRER